MQSKHLNNSWLKNGQLTPRSMARAHHRTLSLSSLGCAGPSSSYTVNTSNPHIIRDQYHEFYTYHHTSLKPLTPAHVPLQEHILTPLNTTFYHNSNLTLNIGHNGLPEQTSDAKLMPISECNYSGRPSIALVVSHTLPFTPPSGDEERQRYSDRTMTDVYADELYNPSFQITSAAPNSSPVPTVTLSRQNDAFLRASSEQTRRARRGRGPRQVIGLNGSGDHKNPDFFVRDVEFRSKEDSPNLARCRLDSQCEVPLLVSEHWVRENDRLSQVSKDFKDPGMTSVSGHEIQVDGILRNMVFNLRGSTVTYRRDVFVCSQLDGWADMVAGAKFIAEQFAVLFSKAKKMFAGIFSFKKETREEKIQRQQLQEQADLEFEESERLRRERKAKEERDKEEARRSKREAESQMAQNGQATSRV